MSGIIDLLAAVFLIGGFFFLFVGTIGLLRLPDTYTRLHATGKCDTLGAMLTLLGCMFVVHPVLFRWCDHDSEQGRPDQPAGRLSAEVPGHDGLFCGGIVGIGRDRMMIGHSIVAGASLISGRCHSPLPTYARITIGNRYSAHSKRWFTTT